MVGRVDGKQPLERVQAAGRVGVLAPQLKGPGVEGALDLSGGTPPSEAEIAQLEEQAARLALEAGAKA